MKLIIKVPITVLRDLLPSTRQSITGIDAKEDSERSVHPYSQHFPLLQLLVAPFIPRIVPNHGLSPAGMNPFRQKSLQFVRRLLLFHAH